VLYNPAAFIAAWMVKKGLDLDPALASLPFALSTYKVWLGI